MSEILLLYVTAPDHETAELIAKSLVEEKRAACVNILAPMTSVFSWDGAVQSAAEIAFIVKTTASAAPGVRARICALHPYDTPCILALPSDAGQSDTAFLRWIEHAVTNA